MVSREHLSEVAENYYNDLNQQLKTSAEHSPKVLILSTTSYLAVHLFIVF